MQISRPRGRRQGSRVDARAAMRYQFRSAIPEGERADERDCTRPRPSSRSCACTRTTTSSSPAPTSASARRCRPAARRAAPRSRPGTRSPRARSLAASRSSSTTSSSASRRGTSPPARWCTPQHRVPRGRPRPRALLPLHSMMIATEPMPESSVEADRPAPARDLRRSAPHRHLRPAHRRRPPRLRRPRQVLLRVRHRRDLLLARRSRSSRACRSVLEALFPIVRQHRITHRWGGPLGVPRDWQPVRDGIDRRDPGLAWGGRLRRRGRGRLEPRGAARWPT